MECISVSPEHLIIEKQRFNNNRNEYRLDLWQEMKKRWMVFAVLFTVMMATITPKWGAPGGRLHLEYVSYVPLTYIYYTAGQRTSCETVSHWTLLLSVVHTHIVSPAVCIITVNTFRDSLDYRVIDGALLCSLGGGCPWLALALCECGAGAPTVLASGAAALVVVPLASLLACGSFSPSLQSVAPLLAMLAPFCAGRRRRACGAGRAGWAARAAALLLLYADCCRRLTDAEGSLHVRDVLGPLALVVCWLGGAAAAAAGAARAARAPALAHALLAASLKGWELAPTCGAPGLAALPGVFLAPAQALLLAAARCPAGAGEPLPPHSGASLTIALDERVP